MEIEDVIVLDESRCQNTTNTARRICNPTINGKKDKNKLKKTGERYGVNGIGFQGINCHSAIYFNQKNNSNNFVLTICKYLISRIENPKASKILYKQYSILENKRKESNKKLTIEKTNNKDTENKKEACHC